MFEGESSKDDNSTSGEHDPEDEQSVTVIEPEPAIPQGQERELTFMQLSEMQKEDVERMQKAHAQSRTKRERDQKANQEKKKFQKQSLAVNQEVNAGVNDATAVSKKASENEVDKFETSPTEKKQKLHR